MAGRDVLEEVGDGLSSEMRRTLARPSVQAGMVSLLMGALASHALVWTVTLGAMAAWGWTVTHPTGWTIAASVGYCVTVLLGILWRDGRGG